MTEDDEPELPADGTAALYDWFKHLTSLCLIALGGVISLAALPDSHIRRSMLAIILIILALAGVLSFAATNAMVNVRTTGRPLPKSVRQLQKIIPFMLVMAVSMFLALFLMGSSDGSR